MVKLAALEHNFGCEEANITTQLLGLNQHNNKKQWSGWTKKEPNIQHQE